jgi:hypothetical protein
MAGIEEAFEKFVTRVSGRERSPAEQPLSKYKSYSEQELLENIEAKYPNQLQSFSQEDYQLNTMPMFEPKDVAPYKSYSPMPVEKYLRGRDYMDLAEGGVAGLQITSMRPTQQESTAGLVFNPEPYEGPYTGPLILGGPQRGQYYQSSPITSITGPDGAIPRPGMPMMSSPSAQTLQTDVSTNSIAKALEMAGFTKEEIMRILGQQGLANGGRVSMSDGGLTTTVPPAKGPDSQGVESLFRRRYS